MANLDLSTIWNTIMTFTKQSGVADKGGLGELAKNIIGSISNSPLVPKKADGSLDFAAIAQQIMTLWQKYGNSANVDEKNAAANAKNISDLVSAMSGNASADTVINAAKGLLGDRDGDGDVDLADAAAAAKEGLSKLKGLFGR